MKWPLTRKTPRRPRKWDVTDTGGTEARQRAERELARLREETAAVQAETPKYAQQGRDLRRVYDEHNHLAEAFMLAAYKGGKS